MKHNQIQMADIITQYYWMKPAIDQAMEKVLLHGRYINGPEVGEFSAALSAYLDGARIVTCGNGTDALQAALMALDLEPGDEVIIPDFSFVSPAEVVALLGMQPVPADVDPRTFNLDPRAVRQVITGKTRAVIPVHLFGQAAPMDEIMGIAEAHGLYVVEDAAQSLGTTCFVNGEEKAAGTIGHIGCTSFFPSKNLGCFGDGGACITHDPELAERLDKIVHHGAREKYYNEMIGINSRLDTLQAAVLIEKLKHLDDLLDRRRKTAEIYLKELKPVSFVQLPENPEYGKHSFNQFTLKVTGGLRDNLKKYLSEKGIPSMIYYPYPVHHLPAFEGFLPEDQNLPVSEQLCGEVLSLPMHTELMTSEVEYIAEQVRLFEEGL
ncbi:MAG: DegT/DnrJ/EryC1/StrS family aminotransferase [Marinilabiliaceae bacterium]